MEGISPRNSQVHRSLNESAVSHGNSTVELKPKSKKSNGKCSSSASIREQRRGKLQPKHNQHARRVKEKRPHLRLSKLDSQSRKSRDKTEVSNEVFSLCVHPSRRKDSSGDRKPFEDISGRDLKTPTSEEIKLLEDISQRLPEKALFDILCGHFAKVGSHTRDEFLRRAIKWRRGTSYRKTNSHCIICYLQRLAAQPIQTDYNRMLPSAFIPRNHYDLYSRGGARRKASGQHGMLNICKKADLMLKNRNNQTPPPPPPGSSALESNPSKCMLDLSVTPDLSEYSDSTADRLMQMYTQPKQRDIHTQCQARLPPFLLNSGELPADLAAVYKRKALRGGFLKKDQPSERINKTDAEIIKEITYPIGSLGLSFKIPQHNQNLPRQKSEIFEKVDQPMAYRPSLPILPPIRRITSGKTKAE